MPDDFVVGEDRAANGIRIEIQHPDVTFPTDRIRDVLEVAARNEGVRVGDVTVVLADHETVLELNRTYLDHDYLTDVLAFDFAENDTVEGEIYVDVDTARERCREFDADPLDETLRYALHGLLHLIGYTDKTPEAKRAIRALEDRYLRAAR